MADFDGKSVMITGAASGFGRLAAQRFASEGARLALSDVNSDALGELAETLRDKGTEVVADAVDVTRKKQVVGHVIRAAGAFGGLDIALNNAGIGHDLKPLDSITEAEFDLTMAVNAKGVFLCMKAQLPIMVRAGGGAILNVASAAGLVGAQQLAAYVAAKHAVIGLTRTAADEVARKNVRVNAICPSFSSTPLFDEMADQIAERIGADRQTAYKRITSRIPMGRVSAPEEVVEAMLLICNPKNTFMTGQAIAIDGGLTAT